MVISIDIPAGSPIVKPRSGLLTFEINYTILSEIT